MRARFVSVVALAVIFGLVGSTLAQGKGKGNGNGNGKGKGHQKQEQRAEDDRGYSYRDSYYGDRERREAYDWYSRQSSLPPGLAKKDRLPPGLEKQLVRRGTLPPGLQKKIMPCPPELVRYLPAPPPGTAHVVVGGHIVLLNRKTNVIVDVFSLFR